MVSLARVETMEEGGPVTQTRRLRARRVSMDLSQQAAAERIGAPITRDALSRIETGEQWPTAVQFIALARFYRVSPALVFEEALEAWVSRRPEEATFESDSPSPALQEAAS